MTDLISAIGYIIVTEMLGGALIAGLVAFFFFIVMGVVLRFTADAWIALMPATLWVMFFHPETALLPAWIWQIAAIALSVIIGIGMIRIWNRR